MTERYSIDAQNRIRTVHEEEESHCAPSFASREEWEELVSNWPVARLVAVWNQLPEVRTVSHFENRRVAAERIWRQLTSSPESVTPPRGSASRSRARQTKSERVLRMLRRPEGVTLKALVKATGWQAHTVRGFLSRKVGRELALALHSFRRDGERVYQISERASGN